MILTITPNPAIDRMYSVPRHQPGSVMRVEEVLESAGGKGLNVARVVARLGEAACAMGFVGGISGDLYLSLIQEPGLACAFTRVQASTRTSVNIWDQATGESTEYLEPGPCIHPSEHARFLEDFQQMLPRASVVTLSGSVPPGLPQDFHAQIVRICKQLGVPVFVDASGPSLKAAVTESPDLIKPNLEEFAWLTQLSDRREASIIGAALKLLEKGPQRLLISMGAQGALFFDKDSALRGVPPKVEPLNTVGCGDSMLGGFAIALSRGWSQKEALRYAIAVSAAATQTRQVGRLNPSDVESYLPLVEISSLSL